MRAPPSFFGRRPININTLTRVEEAATTHRPPTDHPRLASPEDGARWVRESDHPPTDPARARGAPCCIHVRMVLVRVRIFLGKALLGEPTRPFAPEVTVKAVVDSALEGEDMRKSRGGEPYLAGGRRAQSLSAFC